MRLTARATLGHLLMTNSALQAFFSDLQVTYITCLTCAARHHIVSSASHAFLAMICSSCICAVCSGEEFTDLGERLRIKVVPSFYFYKNAQLVDQFATRDRKRIAAAINKHVGCDVAGGEPIF